MGNAPPDPLMLRVRGLFKASGMTFEQLGQKMGYSGDTARKSAWQFVDRTNDPRLSMLRRFAKAIGMTLEELVAEKEKGRAKESSANKSGGATSKSPSERIKPCPREPQRSEVKPERKLP